MILKSIKFSKLNIPFFDGYFNFEAFKLVKEESNLSKFIHVCNQDSTRYFSELVIIEKNILVISIH